MKTKVRVTLITDQGERFYGPGVQDLLSWIREKESVKEACAAMDISYTKGRRILKHAEAVLGYPLVLRQQGGANGGFAHLTPQAEEFMQRYEAMNESVKAYTENRMNEIFV